MKRRILLAAWVTVGALSMTVAGVQHAGRGAARQDGLLQQPQGPAAPT